MGARGPRPVDDGRVLIQMAIRIKPEILAAIRAGAKDDGTSYAIAVGRLIEQAYDANR